MNKVVLHSLAFKNFFRGHLRQTVEPVLQRIERILARLPEYDVALLPRIFRIGGELPRRREIKSLGKTQAEMSRNGCLDDRIERLIESLLEPLEKRHATGGARSTYICVQQVRTKLLPDLILGKLSVTAVAERHIELETPYKVQEMDFYPRDYLGEHPSNERVLETVERLEENITDQGTVHRPFDCVMQVGNPIEVSARRERRTSAGRDGAHRNDVTEPDSLTLRVERAIQTMVDGLCAGGPAP